MAPTDPNSIFFHSNTIDPSSGFCSATKTYRSLRPSVPLPPPSQPISFTDYALSLHPAAAASSGTYLVDSTTGRSVTYSQFLRQATSLALHLKARFPSLSKGDVAFILLPTSLHLPVVYFSLLSLGVVVSPVSPLSSQSEIEHQIRVSSPVIAFANSATACKLPELTFGTVLVDSPEFLSALAYSGDPKLPTLHNVNRVSQSDAATIMYSSGTTGRIKGVLMAHRSIIATIGGFHKVKAEKDLDDPEPHPVQLLTVPLYHIYGFLGLFVGFVNGETLILTERFDFEAMLRAVEKYRVTCMPVSPPVVFNLVKSDLTARYDLRSLRTLICGGAALGREVSERFEVKFPHMEITQGYAMTESSGGASIIGGSYESKRYGSVGRLAVNMEAMIVDPLTSEALPPGHPGELWLRGPYVMKCYVGEEKATAETLNKDGWLKTGDLCYFDAEGFLYIVDRLKELIKYKAYQVAPVELESILQSHPEIADVAVIPYPDEEAGQIPMACVVRKRGSNLTESQIIDFVAKQVAPHKKVRRVAFVGTIPKSPAGKILRRHLIASSLANPKL